MPKFNYVAMDSRGKETKGTLEVANQNEAIGRLKEMGFFPTKVVEVERPRRRPTRKPKLQGNRVGKKGGLSPNFKIPGLGGGVKTKVLTAFTRQLATLVDAGLPLLRGLRVLEKQEKNPTLKGIIAELAISIEGGSTFSEGLAQHPKVFNRLYVNMVKAGELGGVLEVVLEPPGRIHGKGPENQRQSRRRHVLPRRRHDRGGVHPGRPDGLGRAEVQGHLQGHAARSKTCPGSPVFVLGHQRRDCQPFLHHGGRSWLSWSVGVPELHQDALRTARLWDRFKLNMPVLGPVISKVAISRFTRTLGTLVSSGVPILQALTIVKETSGNVIVGDAVGAVHESVKEGETITAPLEASNVFPPWSSAWSTSASRPAPCRKC